MTDPFSMYKGASSADLFDVYVLGRPEPWRLVSAAHTSRSSTGILKSCDLRVTISKESMDCSKS